MTSGFEVDLPLLRATAGSITRLGEEVNNLPVVPGFGNAINRALPRTASADMAAALATMWEQQVRRWSAGLDVLGGTLVQICNTYERTDEETYEALRALVDRLFGEERGR